MMSSRYKLHAMADGFDISVGHRAQPLEEESRKQSQWGEVTDHDHAISFKKGPPILQSATPGIPGRNPITPGK
jgi:hypothetical protein